MKEKAAGIVDIGDCDPPTFSDCLRYYLYYENVEGLCNGSVFILFIAANKENSVSFGVMKKNLSVDTKKVNVCFTIPFIIIRAYTYVWL